MELETTFKKLIKINSMGLLALEDGTVMHGEPFGGKNTVLGEICFNTSMTGYQEILTDPSYKGQIVAMTYPEIGNYGISPEDIESYRPHLEGFIVRELSPIASNWRSRQTLPDYLAEHKIPALQGIDTRALTKKLREAGSLKALLTTEPMDEKEAVQKARSWHGLEGIDYVAQVTCKKPFQWEEGAASFTQTSPMRTSEASKKYRAVVFDFGTKYNILRSLRSAGFEVQVVPAHTSAEEALSYQPDGILLSNGPGDPSALKYAHQTIRKLAESQKPIFGICLGHQLIGHAFGGKTFKLKFGHRGANQPVKELKTGRVSITSQNHGYAVDPSTLPDELEVTHLNLNDNTCEGLRHKTLPIFAVQYHPEASPGPHDSLDLFKAFFTQVANSHNS